MAETKRIGVEVDEDLWEEFRRDVQRRKGRTSGVLGAELETAIRQYIYTGEDRDEAEILREIEDRLGRVESAVDPPSADGGTVHISGGDGHTHTSTTDDDPPHPKAPVGQKVAWLVGQVAHRTEIHAEKEIGREIEGAWGGFREDTHDKLVAATVDALDRPRHPANDDLLVTEDRHAEIVENQRADTEEAADAELAELEAAEVE